MDVFNHRLRYSKKKTISKVENKSKDNIQTEVWRPKKKKKNEEKYNKRHVRKVEKDQHTCKWVSEVEESLGIIMK